MVSQEGGAPKPLLQAKDVGFVTSDVSPDGRWLAYASTEAARGGAWNVFVEPLPQTGAKYQVSTMTASTPVWSNDGKRLYFAFTNRVYGADVHSSPGFSASEPIELDAAGSIPSTPPTRHFDVLPDGRLLVVIPGTDPSTRQATPRVQVVLNWIEEVKAKVPIGR
jgi:hypothetical protein